MSIPEEKRKIWAIGKSKKSSEEEGENGKKGRKGTFVVSLPAEWSNDAGGEGAEIIVSHGENRQLILSPIEFRVEPKSFTLRVKNQNISFLRYKIISAYLNNYEEIRVISETENEDFTSDLTAVFKDLNDKLLGVFIRKYREE